MLLRDARPTDSLSVETTNYGSPCGSMCCDEDCVPWLRTRVRFLENQLATLEREYARKQTALFRIKAAWTTAREDIDAALSDGL